MRELALADGLTVLSLNADETRFVYREVFEERCYLQHGIELHDGAVVFDVGAHIGLAAIFFHREKKDVRVFAFEPNPAARERLQTNLQLHGVNARVFRCGLWRESGSVEYTLYPANAASSGFYADAEADRATTRTYMVNSGVSERGADHFAAMLFRKATTIACPVRALSEVVDEEGVTRIDLLKVNVEKSESEVLAGIRAEHWALIRQAVVEVFDVAGRLSEVKRLFQENGFAVATEQDPLLRGTAWWNVYATRPRQV